MTVQLEVLDDPSAPGFYMVEVCDYPTANHNTRSYHVFQFDGHYFEWCEGRHPSRKNMIVYGWHGPIELDQLETLDDPTATGYYVVLLQPWPGQSPHYKKLEVCIWRRGAWYDKYGWAKQYGNILGWLGPFPMLQVDVPWVRQNEKEEAEDIGL